MHIKTSWPWIVWTVLSLWLLSSGAVIAAQDSGKQIVDTPVQRDSNSVIKSIPAPSAPWERTALIGTLGVITLAGAADHVSPAVIAASLGGALGSVTRYMVSQMLGDWLEYDYPYGTMSVNIVGSFAFGLVGGWVGLRSDTPDGAWFTLVTTGFLGGFSTFSSFSYDAVNLAHSGGLYSSALYVVLSVGVSIGALLVGEVVGGYMAALSAVQ